MYVYGVERAISDATARAGEVQGATVSGLCMSLLEVQGELR